VELEGNPPEKEQGRPAGKSLSGSCEQADRKKGDADLPAIAHIESPDLQEIFACSGRLVEEIGILKSASKDAPVVIKPNLFTPSPFSTGRTSDPRIVEGICRRLMAEGIEPVIAEGSGNHYSGEYIFEATGYRRLAHSLGIRLIDLNEDSCGLLRLPGGPDVEYAATLLESPIIINVPKVKTHIQTGVTLALKNLMGGLTKKGRVDFHFTSLHRNIPALAKALIERGKHIFTIADGIISMEGKGPFTGEAKHTGFILGARDPFTADVALCSLMGFDPWSIEHVREAASLFDVEGARISALRQWASGQRNFMFKKARSFRTSRAWARWGTWVSHLPAVDLLLYRLRLKPLVRRLIGREAPVLDHSKCAGCMECGKVCPMHCFAPRKDVVSIDISQCAGCMICVEFCPGGALSMKWRIG
jgi:uncharacterized protein (DUF362 family)/NAD-dependent dihydropyrimidine dehydrogenase PreA subunit